jgi:transposase
VGGDLLDRAQVRRLLRDAAQSGVRRAEVDGGARPGLASEERQRLKQLERENRELRRANEILKSASASFAAELDRRPG